MSSYSKARRELAERAQSDSDGQDGVRLPCAYCGAPTDRKTLSMLGARCGACYEQWLARGYSGSMPAARMPQAKWIAKWHADQRNQRRAPSSVLAKPMEKLAQAASAVLARRRAQSRSMDDINHMLHEAGK